MLLILGVTIAPDLDVLLALIVGQKTLLLTVEVLEGSLHLTAHELEDVVVSHVVFVISKKYLEDAMFLQCVDDSLEVVEGLESEGSTMMQL